MTPHTLCTLAVAAAILAAGIGWRYNPGARARRQQRRHQELVRQAWALEFRRVRLILEGEIAIHGLETLWLRLLANHPELYAAQSDQAGGAS